MKLITRGLQIGQAFRNVQRARQIMTVFSRQGFEDILIRMKLENFAPLRFLTRREEIEKKHPAQRLRESFEELGPTFIKLGQLLSTRPDLLPETYIEEFVKLQDQTPVLEFEAIKSVIEKDLGKTAAELFAWVDPKPLASASIAQVHEARLHTGEKVVIKVQRPGIEEQIKQDISLLTAFAGLLEKYVPETRILNPKIFADEFFKTLNQELDFHIEANNMAKFALNMKDVEEIVVPKIYKDLCSTRVLTQEKLEGVRITDEAGLSRQGTDRHELVKTGARAFFKSVVIDGLFHGDLHAGNLFALPDNKLGLIDFGIMGRLSQKSRDKLTTMFVALIQEDYENLCYIYAELGGGDLMVDFEAFEREVRSAVAPYMGLNLAEVNTGRVLIESTKIAAKYNIRVPGEWMIVFKAILTVEGMGRTLDPNFDLLSIGQDLVKDIVKNQLSLARFKKDIVWVARDVAALLQILPRQIRWMFKKFNRDSFAFEIKVPEIELLQKEMAKHGKRVSLSIVIVGLLIAGVWLLDSNHPYFANEATWLPYSLLVLAGILLLRLMIF